MPRRINRTHGVTPLGPDAQVDNKALVIPPGNFALADPFLLLSEDWFSSPGFEWHPHRGLETVTIVLDGALEHGDNLGSAGVLGPGDVQWMTAGRGIIHRELAFRNEHAHTLQLWVNLPRSQKMTETRYQDLRASTQGVLAAPGSQVSVISGTAGATGGPVTSGTVTGPAKNHWPITGLRITIQPGGVARPPRRRGREPHPVRRPADRRPGLRRRAFRHEYPRGDHPGLQRLPFRQVWPGPEARAAEGQVAGRNWLATPFRVSGPPPLPAVIGSGKYVR